MITSRPPYQPELDLPMPGRGEAPCRDGREVEAFMARADPESLASTERLMEAICDQDNIEAALDAVVRNKGAPGIDGITVKQLPSILKARWPEIEDQLLHGRYQPQPVRRVQIPVLLQTLSTGLGSAKIGSVERVNKSKNEFGGRHFTADVILWAVRCTFNFQSAIETLSGCWPIAAFPLITRPCLAGRSTTRLRSISGCGPIFR